MSKKLQIAAAEVLSKVPVTELIKDDHKLFFVGPTWTVREVLDILTKYTILSVPVINEDAKILGMVSIADILTFMVLKSGFEKIEKGEPVHEEELISEEDLDFPAEKIIGISKKENTGDDKEIPKTTQRPEKEPSLQALVKAFSSSGFHRVVVEYSPVGDVKPDISDTHFAVITQSDLVNYFLDNSTEFGDFMKIRVEELGLAHPLGMPVVTMTDKETALEGFFKIYSNNINALAVLKAEDDTICSTLSASDLRGITPDKMNSLLLPVTEFLKERHEGVLIHPLTASTRSSLEDVITKLVRARKHRVWIVDAAEKVLGVITLTDIIRVFNSE